MIQVSLFLKTVQIKSLTPSFRLATAQKHTLVVANRKLPLMIYLTLPCKTEKSVLIPD